MESGAIDEQEKGLKDQEGVLSCCSSVLQLQGENGGPPPRVGELIDAALFPIRCLPSWHLGPETSTRLHPQELPSFSDSGSGKRQAYVCVDL